MAEVIFSPHAKFKIGQRAIDETILRAIIENPEQSFEIEASRIVCQSRYFDNYEGKDMLLRVVAEMRLGAFYVITAYKTSKIEKCWKPGGA